MATRLIGTDTADPKLPLAVMVASGINESLYLPAEQMVATLGAPVIADAADVTSLWSLDAAASEAVAGKVTIPIHWTTFDVRARFLNTTAVAGDVRVFCNVSTLATGSQPATSNGTLVTVAIPATQFSIVEATLRSAFAVSTDRRVSIAVIRSGPDAGDTLAGDVGLLDVRLVRAS